MAVFEEVPLHPSTGRRSVAFPSSQIRYDSLRQRSQFGVIDTVAHPHAACNGARLRNITGVAVFCWQF